MQTLERTLFLNGTIAVESWFDDDVTPKLFRDELFTGETENITIWINSPGGDVCGRYQIYNMMMEYPGNVTVKIDGIAASAASVIAMAGTKVLVSPVSTLMIHNPMTMLLWATPLRCRRLSPCWMKRQGFHHQRLRDQDWYEPCQALPSHGCRDLDGCAYGHRYGLCR